MHLETKNKLLYALKPKEKLSVTDFAEANIVIPSDYPSPYKGKYDSSICPLWKELQDSLTDNSIDEIIVQKASQGGASQALITMLSYSLATFSAPSMYIHASHELSEEFREERIIPIIQNTKALKEWFRQAEQKETGKRKGKVLQLGNGASLITVNSGSIADSKSRAIKYIFADEIDAYGSNILDKFRSRLTHYRGIGGKLIAISTPDITLRASRKNTGSPIATEIEKTDKRKYFLKKGKEEFNLEWGIKDKETGKLPNYGVRWSKEAKNHETETYDYDLIRETIYYLTPDGKKIKQEELNSLIQKGEWKATNPKPTDKRKRGYLTNAIYWRPMEELAIEFIEAKKAGWQQLRTWIAENLGEVVYSEKREIQENELKKLEKDYGKGTSYFDREEFKDVEKKRVLTFDVQKYNLWYLVTEIARGGAISIIDWGSAVTFEDVNEIANKYNCNFVMGDSGYALRRREMHEACLKYSFYACYGTSQKETRLDYSLRHRDPFEGTSKQGVNSITEYEFNTHLNKHEMMDRFKGRGQADLYLYYASERELTQQLTAERFIDGAFEQLRRDNHLFDCLCMAHLVGKISGINSNLLN